MWKHHVSTCSWCCNVTLTTWIFDIHSSAALFAMKPNNKLMYFILCHIIKYKLCLKRRKLGTRLLIVTPCTRGLLIEENLCRPMHHFDHITYTDSVSPKSFRCRPEPFPATLHWTPLVDTQPHHAGNPQCPFQSTETTSRWGPLDPGVTVSLLAGPHLRKQHEQRPNCCRQRESDTAYNVITLRM